MTEVYFVLPPGLLLTDYAAPADAFRIARQLGADFQLRTVAAVAKDEAVLSALGVSIAGVEPLPERLPGNSLVVVCGSSRGVPANPAADRALVGWLKRMAGSEVRLACICSGALYAARAGWLSGRRCTTHHSLVEQLRKLAPDARVQEDRVFVEDGNV